MGSPAWTHPGRSHVGGSQRACGRTLIARRALGPPPTRITTPEPRQPSPTQLGLSIKLVEQLHAHRGLAASLAQQVAILGIRLGEGDHSHLLDPLVDADATRSGKCLQPLVLRVGQSAFERKGDVTIVKLGAGERYAIPDVLVTGG